MTKLGEFELISNYFAPLSGRAGFDLKDDAALIELSGAENLVVTQDAIAENVHFFSDDSADLIAKKAVRVNLSDLIAKGAKAKWLSLSLGLGNDWSEPWVADFARGLKEDCATFGLELTGGDTFKTRGGCVISITMFGILASSRYVSRLKAKPDQFIYVSGTIGDAALGLLVRSGKLVDLDRAEADFLCNRYLLPQPRVSASSIIADFASASMDISDGLVGDLEKLCAASGISAQIEAHNVPLSVATKSVVQTDHKYLETALCGGDDYEFLCCVPADQSAAFERACKHEQILVSRIGVTKTGSGVSVIDSAGKPMDFLTSSYDHSGE